MNITPAISSRISPAGPASSTISGSKPIAEGREKQNLGEGKDQVAFSPEVGESFGSLPGVNFDAWEQPEGGFASLLGDHPDVEIPEFNFGNAQNGMLNFPLSADASPSQSEVAIYDEFAPQGQDPAHGDKVAAVFGQATGDDPAGFQRVTSGWMQPLNPSLLLTLPGEESAQERLTAYIEASSVLSYNSSSAALEATLNSDNGNLKVFNQSSGMTGIEQFFNLDESALVRERNDDGSVTNTGLTPVGAVAFEALGLPTDDLGRDTMLQFAERYLAQQQEVLATSPAVAEARERHSELSAEMADRGIAYVLSAGNNHDELAILREAGIEVPESADDNFLANEHNIVVGSLDTNRTAEPGDDRMAAHSSQYNEVDFLAPGQNLQVEGIDGLLNGTSYAAPNAGAQILQAMRANPTAELNEILESLAQGASHPVAGWDIPVLR